MSSGERRRMRSATIFWSRSRGCRAPTIKPQDASLHRALALDLGLGDFDPLTRDLADDLCRAAPRRSVGHQRRRLAHVGRHRRADRTAGASAGVGRSTLRLQRGRAPRPCSTGSTQDCARRSTPVATPKWRPCCAASTAASCGPARPARRPAAGPTCCRPGAISSRSMSARCRRHRHGGSAGSRPSGWSKAIGRRPANGRARSRCRPGAPPTCAPAATMSRRRWR